jgi:MFS family permease
MVAALLLLPFRVEGGALYATMMLMGVIIGAIPTATFSAVPEVMARPEQAGLGMAILSVGQNAGMVIGPILFGGLVEGLGWAAAANWMMPVCVLGLVSAAALRVR